MSIDLAAMGITGPLKQSQEADRTLGVEFFVKPSENIAKSREAGRPIFEDKEYIRIRMPANPKAEVVAPANEMHYVPWAKAQMTYSERFQANYDAFKQGQVDFIAGTPLDLMPGITPSKREELKLQHVRTVEQLAGLPTQAMRRLGMDGSGLVQMAKDFLARAERSADVADLHRQIADLQAQLAAKPAESVPHVDGAPVDADAYEGFDDEDLVNMIRDAGGNVPAGRRSRTKLVEELGRLAAEKEKAVA